MQQGDAGVRVSPGGPRMDNPHPLRLSETDVHTEWAVDASSKPSLGGIVRCSDKAEAQRLALEYDLPLMRRPVFIVRTIGDWEPA